MKNVLLIALMALAIACTATAGTLIQGEITGDAHWTKAGMPYHLRGMVYVVPGASLTIDAGVIVASYKADGGALAITRGAKFYVNGTKDEPVIFTSAEDVATWDGSVVVRDGVAQSGYPQGLVTSITTLGDPKTGTWRAKCLEWGSIAILGNGYISASHYGDNPVQWEESTDGGLTWDTYTNSKCPGALNKKRMEGMEPEYTGDTRVLYGGADDNDDSGSISYLSCRYGGKVLALADELNGMSLGAVGRETDIDHVEIMNNVDDGIELWGGTVKLSHVSIWNIGDDSLDFDQGWRGSAEYGIIVQGYSQVKKQGSGVGDNCFEHDGAEDADAQPVTTVKISKFTAVGQPGGPSLPGGDGGTAWRDNARVQYESCIWMDLDDDVVKYDGSDGDGANGYDGNGIDEDNVVDNRPADGTLNWNEHWTTSYNQWKAGAYADPQSCGIDFANLYEAYVCTDLDGSLCQITDSVFYNVAKTTEYDRVSALTGANNVGNAVVATMPIQELTRDSFVQIIDGSKAYEIAPVTFINPLPADGVTAGGFQKCNWLAGWTAAYAFGLTDEQIEMGNTDINCDGITNAADIANLGANWLN